MDWFRWYHGTASDPKLAGIARRLNLPRPFVIACWAAVLESASSGDGDARGKLKHDVYDIAGSIDVETADVERILEQMHQGLAPLILQDGTVSAWAKRQFKSDDVTARVRSTRLRRNGVETFHGRSSTVSETPTERDCNAPETETETETDLTASAVKKTRARGALPPDTLAEFEAWWQHWPHKVGKPKAAEAFAKARAKATVAELTVGAQRYAARLAQPNAPLPKHPQGWLNDERWTDQPMEPPHGNGSGTINGTAAAIDRTGHAAFRDGLARAAAARMGPDGFDVPGAHRGRDDGSSA